MRGDELLLVSAAAFLAAATVSLTVPGAVPAYRKLSVYDEDEVQRLLRVSAWRTAAWTAGAVVSLVLVA